LRDIRSFPTSPLEIRLLDIHSLEIRFLNLHLLEIHSVQIRLLEIWSLYIHRPNVSSLEIRLLDIRSFPIRLSRNCSLCVHPFAFCLSEVGLSRWFPVPKRRRIIPRSFLVLPPSVGTCHP
jgi:hypothetical protein